MPASLLLFTTWTQSLNDGKTSCAFLSLAAKYLYSARIAHHFLRSSLPLHHFLSFSRLHHRTLNNSHSVERPMHGNSQSSQHHVDLLFAKSNISPFALFLFLFNNRSAYDDNDDDNSIAALYPPIRLSQQN